MVPALVFDVDVNVNIDFDDVAGNDLGCCTVPAVLYKFCSTNCFHRSEYNIVFYKLKMVHNLNVVHLVVKNREKKCRISC